ncbi:hypothetical protein Tco_1562533 [Tanacetum coccineum]
MCGEDPKYALSGEYMESVKANREDEKDSNDIVHQGLAPCTLLGTYGLEVGWIWRIQELDTAYWGFLGVGTTLDIFQNIILIPYLEYGVLSPLDMAY